MKPDLFGREEPPGIPCRRYIGGKYVSEPEVNELRQLIDGAIVFWFPNLVGVFGIHKLLTRKVEAIIVDDQLYPSTLLL